MGEFTDRDMDASVHKMVDKLMVSRSVRKLIKMEAAMQFFLDGTKCVDDERRAHYEDMIGNCRRAIEENKVIDCQ